MLTLGFLSHHSKHLITKLVEKIINYNFDVKIIIIENIIASDVNVQKSNISKTECNTDKLTLRELLIILGCTIVVLLFIIYNVVFYKLCIFIEPIKKPIR